MKLLPNFDKLPSVLSYDEVNRVFCDIMDFVDSSSTHSINTVEETLNDGISALGYDPKGRFNEKTVMRITSWIKANWFAGDESFLDGAITLYMCVAPENDSGDFFQKTLKNDKRPFVQKELKEALEEIGIQYNKHFK